jgi:hypothetical protein
MRLSRHAKACAAAAALCAALLPASASGNPAAAPLKHVLDGKGRLGGISLAGYQREELPEPFDTGGSKGRVVHGACKVDWARHDVSMSFFVHDMSPCTWLAMSVYIRLRGSWHTSKGLAVGDSVAKLRSVYPRAVRHRARAKVRKRSFPACGPGEIHRLAYLAGWGKPHPESPFIFAEVRNGRVAALGVCTPISWHHAGP